MITPYAAATSRKHAPDGRLTLTTAVPVTTSDVTGASTLYYTPYQGNHVSLYNGSAWITYTFTERSLALSGLTADKNYDVFLYNNAGTLTLELSAAWTNDTTRADALTTQDGVYVKSGATTRLYLGTFRSTATTTTEDSAAKRFLWNWYNPVHKAVRCQDTTNSWTYTTLTYRQKNASSNNQVAVVNGMLGRQINLISNSVSANAGSVDRLSAIGMDSTSAKHADCITSDTAMYPNSSSGITTFLHHATPLGYHYYAELEASVASGTTTWYGDGGGSFTQTGMSGIWEC